jgi:hypothetical protein
MTPERRPITDQERERTRQAIAKLKRDLKAREGQPRRANVNYDKFFGPIGFDDDGNRQPPLTPEERRRKEEWYRKSDEWELRAEERRRRKGDTRQAPPAEPDDE